jgi:hypothetical protein
MGTFTELEAQGHDFNVLLHREEEEDDDDAAGVDELETIAEAPAEDIESAAIQERKESLAHGMLARHVDLKPSIRARSALCGLCPIFWFFWSFSCASLQAAVIWLLAFMPFFSSS